MYTPSGEVHLGEKKQSSCKHLRVAAREGCCDSGVLIFLFMFAGPGLVNTAEV